MKKKKVKKKGPQLNYQCSDCEEKFISWQQRNEHERVEHAPLKITLDTAVMDEEETKLIDANDMQVGDVIYFRSKAVIKSTKKTEGSDDNEVVVIITKRWYSRTKIS